MNAQLFCLALTVASETFAPLPADRVELACQQADHIIEVAEANGIEPTIMAGLIYVESRWSPDAVSHSGACGLTQVIPRYVNETCRELKDPKTSIRVGTESLKKWTTMRVRRDGRLVRVPRSGGIRTALACYNAGYACNRSSTGRAYANAVMRYAARLSALMETQNSADPVPQTRPLYVQDTFLPIQVDRAEYYNPVTLTLTVAN